MILEIVLFLLLLLIYLTASVMLFSPSFYAKLLCHRFFNAHAVFGTLEVLHQDRMTTVEKDLFTVFESNQR